MIFNPVIEALRESGRVSPEDLEWLRRRGKSYTGRKLPSGMKLRRRGSCFSTAEELERDGFGLFVEGFALTPGGDVQHHAWVTPDGRAAIDAVWPRPTASRYFGLPGHTHELRLARIFKPLRTASVFGVTIPFLSDKPAPNPEAA